MGQLAPSVGKEPPLYLLAGIAAIFAGLTLATPFAFQAGGDNAFVSDEQNMFAAEVASEFADALEAVGAEDDAGARLVVEVCGAVHGV